jgi:predicted nucleotidyltransferase
MAPGQEPPDIQVFLGKIENTCRRLCGEYLVSIRLFGSVVDGLFVRGTSDVDFMVIVRDDCPNEIMDHLRLALLRLELEDNIADVRNVGSLQLAFDSRTAFFRSHFVFHRATLQIPNYSRLVEETEAFELPGGRFFQRVLGIFVPWRLVMSNVVSQSVLVFGKDELTNPFPRIAWRLESVRGFLMTFGVSLLGALHSVTSKDGTRISLEAIKWYLIGKASCRLRHRANLETSLALLGRARSNALIQRFEALRRSYVSDRPFSLACPLIILYLQVFWRITYCAR